MSSMEQKLNLHRSGIESPYKAYNNFLLKPDQEKSHILGSSLAVKTHYADAFVVNFFGSRFWTTYFGYYLRHSKADLY